MVAAAVALGCQRLVELAAAAAVELAVALGARSLGMVTVSHCAWPPSFLQPSTSHLAFQLCFPAKVRRHCSADVDSVDALAFDNVHWNHIHSLIFRQRLELV